MSEEGSDVHLYTVYLGGDLIPGRMGEDHEVVLVVAADPSDARSKAKAKWRGHGRPHIDALQRIDRVDGHDLQLTAGEPGDSIELDASYEPSDDECS